MRLKDIIVDVSASRQTLLLQTGIKFLLSLYLLFIESFVVCGEIEHARLLLLHRVCLDVHAKLGGGDAVDAESCVSVELDKAQLQQLEQLLALLRTGVQVFRGLEEKNEVVIIVRLKDS